MAILSKAWNNFKAQPDAWFFYGFLLTFTLSVRKVLFFYPINGNFNEYTGIYLYLSDILLILTILVWIVTIFRNKKLNLSSCIPFFRRQEIYILPLVLLAWTIISISWSDNTNLALFKSLKLAEFTLLFAYVSYNALNKPFLLNTVGFLISLGFIQAIIGIGQFLLQHSIGLFWLKESLISPDIPGVAKIILDGEKYIRVYGLFPHPNILGGFLLISIILTLAYNKLFCTCPIAQNCSTWNNSVAAGVKQFTKLLKVNVSSRTFLSVALIIQSIGLILTFSKSAILGLVLTTVYLVWKKLFHVKQFYRKATIVAAILILGFYLAGLNFDENFDKSVSDRIDQFNVSRETILDHFWAGMGHGQYVYNLQNVPCGTLEGWQYQPVHNVFLLILSELGFVGLFAFVFLLYKLLKKQKLFHVKQGERSHLERSVAESKDLTELDSSTTLEITIFKGILMGLIFILLFDHYLWDIQQGQIMLWLILGILASIKYNTD